MAKSPQQHQSPTKKRESISPLKQMMHSDASLSAEQFRSKYPVQFSSDKELASSWLYRLFIFWFWTLSTWIYGLEVIGQENIKGLRNWFSIGMHTTHNQDIFMGLVGTYVTSGRAVRGMLHRILYKCNPWVAYIGLLPGYRNAAVDLLSSGFVCGVLPGGAEEAMCGHENAYKLHPKWHERRGFVKVARAAGGVPILPWFMKNMEEMRFNPFFFVFNWLGFSRLYAKLMELPGTLGWLFKQVGIWVWYSLSWCSIPVPVKLTIVLGKPLEVDWQNETDEQIAERARDALQALINEHQPYGHQYLPGLQQRWEYLINTQLPGLVRLLTVEGISMDKLKTL